MQFRNSDKEEKVNGHLRQDNATAHTTNFSALEVLLHQQLSHSVCDLVEPYIWIHIMINCGVNISTVFLCVVDRAF